MCEREKQKEIEKEKEEREKQITVTAGPFWRIISNYSYRRASAGELILHYITVGPFPGIRNVVFFAAMVLRRACVGRENAKWIRFASLQARRRPDQRRRGT